MGNNWLDSHARRSAARRQGPQLGMNRRQVLVRGTAVAGGAWAASSLVSAPAYAFGVSGCSAAEHLWHQRQRAAGLLRQRLPVHLDSRRREQHVRHRRSTRPGATAAAADGTCTGGTAVFFDHCSARAVRRPGRQSARATRSAPRASREAGNGSGELPVPEDVRRHAPLPGWRRVQRPARTTVHHPDLCRVRLLTTLSLEVLGRGLLLDFDTDEARDHARLVLADLVV